MTDDTNWSQTYTGQRFDYDYPDNHDYSLRDIGHHLSMINRYGGACLFEYSVAQHSVLLAAAIYRDTKDLSLTMDALFHDAAEAYVHDIRTMLKKMAPQLALKEKQIDKCIRAHFAAIGVPPFQNPLVKKYDRRIILDERKQVLCATADVWKWCEGESPLSVKIKPMRPSDARDTWLKTVERVAKHIAANKNRPGASVVNLDGSQR